MTRFPKEMTENGIHYTLRGDYYFPDLALPESSRQSFGRYGRMRSAYLKGYRPGLYERLLLSGKLYDHLAETDACCSGKMELLLRQVAAAEGIDEELKAKDQLAWIGHMNNIRQRAEEIVLTETIYA